MDFINSDTFIFVWFALWSLGAKPAFINYNLTDKPLLYSVQKSSARVVLVDPRVQSNFDEQMLKEMSSLTFRDDGGNTEICVLDDNILAEIEATPPKREPDSERAGELQTNMAMLIYTSGTTGLPKPAVVTWAKSGLAGRFLAAWLPLKPDDIVYTVRTVTRTDETCVHGLTSDSVCLCTTPPPRFLVSAPCSILAPQSRLVRNSIAAPSGTIAELQMSPSSNTLVRHAGICFPRRRIPGTSTTRSAWLTATAYDPTCGLASRSASASTPSWSFTPPPRPRLLCGTAAGTSSAKAPSASAARLRAS